MSPQNESALFYRPRISEILIFAPYSSFLQAFFKWCLAEKIKFYTLAESFILNLKQP